MKLRKVEKVFPELNIIFTEKNSLNRVIGYQLFERYEQYFYRNSTVRFITGFWSFDYYVLKVR